MTWQRITLEKLTERDMSVIRSACMLYLERLNFDIVCWNRSAHHIHRDIMALFILDLDAKYFRKRERPATKSQKLEVHIAFVLHDAFLYFVQKSDDSYEKAVARKLDMKLFSRLPQTEDLEKMSVDSQL